MAIIEIASRITRKSLRRKRKIDLAWMIHQVQPYILANMPKEELVDIYLRISRQAYPNITG